MQNWIVNGYVLVYKPEHPRSHKTGQYSGHVYEHTLIAEESLKRYLTDDEVVHHLDGNRANNHPTNLLVLLRSEHGRLHNWLSHSGIDLSTTYSGKRCAVCQIPIPGTQNTCSSECRSINRRVVTRPIKEQLEQDLNILPIIKIGSKYGVSDNTIRKWAKSYGIDASRNRTKVI